MIQTKRRLKKGRFRLLHAKLGGRKQRVATAAPTPADLEVDEPNLSVARALIVILLIHVVAVAGIFFHNHFFGAPEAAAAPEPANPAVVVEPREDLERLPVLREGDQPYFVKVGDTYAKIAAARGVAEEDLRRVNDNIPLRSGRILKMPGRRIIAVAPSEMERLRSGLPAAVAATAPVGVETPEAPASTAISTTTAPAHPATHAVETAPRAIVVDQGAAAAAAAGTSHTVVAGDTLWRIASKYKVSTDALMKANGIDDPKKLKLGMTLKIPAAR